MQFSNTITELLDITYPIISAPMAGVSGGELARAVSLAGGLGLIGAGYSDATWLQQQLEITAGTRIGIGFITWQLAQKPELLKIALAKNPVAIMLSFGDATKFVEPIKSSGTKLICQVQTVKDAKIVAKQGADIIVAQGSEAGGHGATRGTFAFVPAVVDAVSPIPVIAAGGIADGRGLAAAMMLGAKGVLIGTRFYACTEALGNPSAKQLIVKSSGDETLRSNIIDYARGLDWLKPYTGRTLKNKFTDKWEHETDLADKINDDERNKYKQALLDEDYSIASVFAGEDIDLIHEILSAEEIVKRIMEDAIYTISK